MESFNNFDAVTFQPDSEKYWFFKGEECWSKKYGSDNEVKHEGLIEKNFTGIPNNLDAVVCNKKNIGFLKGMNVGARNLESKLNTKEL